MAAAPGAAVRWLLFRVTSHCLQAKWGTETFPDRQSWALPGHSSDSQPGSEVSHRGACPLGAAPFPGPRWFPVASQSITELQDPSCCLAAWFAFGYLRETRATFEFRFIGALGRCGAGSARYRQVALCCKPGGEEVMQSRNWFPCISVGKKNTLGWRSRGWKLVPVEPVASGCCLNVMLPCTIGAAVARSLWCIVKHEQTCRLMTCIRSAFW